MLTPAVNGQLDGPVGGFVHLRRGTVDLRLVGLLCIGSVPSAFCGVLVARALGAGLVFD